MSHLTAAGSSTGKGHTLRGLRPWSDLLRLPDAAGQDRDYWTLANDLYFGNLPPAPTRIPYTWLSPPAVFRPDAPINTATVSAESGATGSASDTNSISEHGVSTPPFTSTLATDTRADPQNLANWLVTYYTGPRMRMPNLTLNLLNRSIAECRRILRRQIGDRISITDPPVTWPAGASELVIEGIAHSVAADTRTVTWATSPVIGVETGTVGPWVRADQSPITGTHAWAY